MAVYFFLFYLLRRNALLINSQKLLWTGNCKGNIYHPHEIPSTHIWLHTKSLAECPLLTPSESFSAICRLVEGAPNPTICVIGKDVKVYWSQDGLLGDTMCEWPLSEHKATGNSLAMTIQSILYPLDSLACKSILLQLWDKGVVQDLVKGLAEFQVDNISWYILLTFSGVYHGQKLMIYANELYKDVEFVPDSSALLHKCGMCISTWSAISGMVASFSLLESSMTLLSGSYRKYEFNLYF